MTSRTRYKYAMTLRLLPEMQSELEDIAWEWRVSQAQVIRTFLARGIMAAQRERAKPCGMREGTL